MTYPLDNAMVNMFFPYILYINTYNYAFGIIHYIYIKVIL